MEVYKFRRYKVPYKKKYYYIYIPFEYDQLWIIDWADWWYGGAWIDGNIQCLKYLIASFCILAFNPYAIIYLPIRNNKRPNTFAFGDNCEYDLVFRTTNLWIRDKDLKKMVKNLKYTRWTTYKCKINLERMKRYFHDNIKKIEDIPDYKILVNADGHINGSIIYYSFPQVWYQQEAIDLVDYFFNEIFTKDDFSDCYDEKYDWFSKPFASFVWSGKRKSKYTYKRPSLTFYIEFYDIDIMNKYAKEKIYLVDKNKI